MSLVLEHELQIVEFISDIYLWIVESISLYLQIVESISDIYLRIVQCVSLK